MNLIFIDRVVNAQILITWSTTGNKMDGNTPRGFGKEDKGDKPFGKLLSGVRHQKTVIGNRQLIFRIICGDLAYDQSQRPCSWK